MQLIIFHYITFINVKSVSDKINTISRSPEIVKDHMHIECT